MKKKSECPVCKATHTEYGHIRNMRTHIVSRAKNELFTREFYEDFPTPHLKYIKENGIPERIIKTSTVNIKFRI